MFCLKFFSDPKIFNQNFYWPKEYISPKLINIMKRKDNKKRRKRRKGRTEEQDKEVNTEKQPHWMYTTVETK